MQNLTGVAKTLMNHEAEIYLEPIDLNVNFFRKYIKYIYWKENCRYKLSCSWKNRFNKKVFKTKIYFVDISNEFDKQYTKYNNSKIANIGS